ncbi:DUF4251 domain-containing protein [Dinghuibacter silviterrae]|uniref:Uncharacterized protein DUF4251 n=1 Tax=Dinghuibacter silviterrae TaxID=1539049 RepID=A0A4R8DSF8_9BACT|nr:DUF4251 domain-containing protein [Dinghuibacter silviterrae]TDX01192.1 uncharacterized protein DUF4251 [Dinghuibacter silviterrae]
MKTSIALTFLLLAAAGGVRAQNATADLINAQDYRFIAQSAMAMGGRTRQLAGGDYDLIVTRDTVIAYLPYYGRAYTAPMGSDEGGIKFTSTKFDYVVTPTKRGGWDITIKPQDARDVTQLNLSVSSKGYASLQVTSINRQGISFNGEVVKRRRRK